MSWLIPKRVMSFYNESSEDLTSKTLGAIEQLLGTAYRSLLEEDPQIVTLLEVAVVQAYQPHRAKGWSVL